VPEFYNEDRALTMDEMKVNMTYAKNYLITQGWSLNAICGMAGNWQSESTINPNRKQVFDRTWTIADGYGLVQWTPSTNYTNWCTSNSYDPVSLLSALKRIEYERSTSSQYYQTDAYPLSFGQFMVSTESPTYLANAFLYNYERPRDKPQSLRGEQAEAWLSYLNGTPDPDPDPTTPPIYIAGDIVTVIKAYKESPFFLIPLNRKNLGKSFTVVACAGGRAMLTNGTKRFSINIENIAKVT